MSRWLRVVLVAAALVGVAAVASAVVCPEAWDGILRRGPAPLEASDDYPGEFPGIGSSDDDPRAYGLAYLRYVEHKLDSDVYDYMRHFLEYRDVSGTPLMLAPPWWDKEDTGLPWQTEDDFEGRREYDRIVEEVLLDGYSIGSMRHFGGGSGRAPYVAFQVTQTDGWIGYWRPDAQYEPWPEPEPY